MTNQKSEVRPLKSTDVALLVKWLSDPEVLAFYEGGGSAK
ncbi:GNAT family N-acetyltransferase [Terribacillus sp. AE2B 122]|nr:GNAT family N-acetyltransferase [Terribacillus sp. AE2B 122]